MSSTHPASAEELAGFHLEPGRGYRTEDVEALRDHAVTLVEAQQRRIDQLQEAVDALRAELATESSGPDLRQMLRQADPSIVRAESSVAAGEILALAVDAADRYSAKITADLSTARQQTVTQLEEIVALAQQGRRPDYGLHRLVLAMSGLIEKLQADPG